MKCPTCEKEHDGGKGSRGNICVTCVRKRDAKYRQKFKTQKIEQAKVRTEKRKKEIENNPDLQKDCLKCGKTKTVKDFREFKNQCKECESNYTKEYNEKHPNRMKKYYNKNKEKHLQQSKERYRKHKDKQLEELNKSIIKHELEIDGKKSIIEQRAIDGSIDVKAICILYKKQLSKWKDIICKRLGTSSKPNKAGIEKLTGVVYNEWLYLNGKKSWLNPKLIKYFTEWIDQKLEPILQKWYEEWQQIKTNEPISIEPKFEEEVKEHKSIEVEEKKELDNIHLNTIIPFNEKEVRIVGTYEKPWFVAIDVAEILGYAKPDKAIRNHVDDEDKQDMGSVDFHPPKTGGSIIISEKAILINESGLYALIFKSKLKTAKVFKKWVTSEVLPSLRKKGYYQNSPEMQEQFNSLNKKLKDTEQKIIEYEEKNNKLSTENTDLIKINRRLTGNLNQLRKLHHYVRFNIEGACYYIYTVPNPEHPEKHVKIRAGIAGTKGNERLDKRLEDHRTDDSNMHLELIITSSALNIIELEKMMKLIHKETMIAPNHELWSDKQDLGEFMESAKDSIGLLCKKDENGFDLLQQSKINEYNQDLQKTLIK